MASELIVVFGATGNIGNGITRILLSRGRQIRAVGRSAERLAELVTLGAEPAVGSVEDAGFVAGALAEAAAAFTLNPPNLTTPDVAAHQDKVTDAIASGVERSGVSHVVNLSSIGAHLESGTGPIAGLHRMEKRLDRIPGLNVVHLRPAFFMENLLADVDVIRTIGTDGGLLRPDVALPMIATSDIAAAASELLDRRDFTGSSVVDLLGPRDYTMQEAAHILGEAVGKPDLGYVQFPVDAVRSALAGQGISESVSDSWIEMYGAANDGKLRSTATRSAENTTATTLERFAETVFRPAYKHAESADR
jgi:uncharacterized protein YbjT (DUF2867 family)